MCSHDPIFGTNKNRISKNGSCECGTLLYMSLNFMLSIMDRVTLVVKKYRQKLNRDLEIISTWAYQWKMQFNPDKNKQAIQVIFCQGLK